MVEARISRWRAPGERGVPGRGSCEELRRLSGGASKESWGFVIDSRWCGRSGAACRTAETRFAADGSIAIETEAALLRVAHGSGVPVPRVLFELDRASGFRGYVMERVKGESVGSRILKDPALTDIRESLARQCGRILAAVHSIGTDRLPTLETLGPAALLTRFRDRYLATGQDRPVFDLAFRWIEDRLPREAAPILVHGDFRNGNLMVGRDGIRAVFDWEMAHLGHPAEDLGWVCVTSWRFQRPELRVGGFGPAENCWPSRKLAPPHHPGRAHSGDVRHPSLGVMCAEFGALSSPCALVEGAMIARRASETEYDLMRLIGAKDD